MDFLERFANLPKNLTQCGFNADIKNAKIDEVDVFIALCFIQQNFEKKKTIKIESSSHSYTLKHVAERALGFYVSNGTLIAAMLLDGFQFNYFEKLNCCFNIKKFKESELVWNHKSFNKNGDDYLITLHDFANDYEMSEELLLMFNIRIELEERKLLNKLQNEA